MSRAIILAAALFAASPAAASCELAAALASGFARGLNSAMNDTTLNRNLRNSGTTGQAVRAYRSWAEVEVADRRQASSQLDDMLAVCQQRRVVQAQRDICAANLAPAWPDLSKVNPNACAAGVTMRPKDFAWLPKAEREPAAVRFANAQIGADQ
jgi:hypothetical protein